MTKAADIRLLGLVMDLYLFRNKLNLGLIEL